VRLSRVAVPAVLLSVLLVSGCHGAPDASDRSAPAVTTGTSADPLSDVESTVDAIQHDVDADADG
jgi:outer membrane murein-binding lipoprotein Lpp